MKFKVFSMKTYLNHTIGKFLHQKVMLYFDTFLTLPMKAEEWQHRSIPYFFFREIFGKKNKTPENKGFRGLKSGPDETRTRDLLRDRQAF